MEQACLDNGISEFGCSLITWGLYVGYLLMIVAIAAVVVLPLMNALKSPKELLKSGLAIAALVVVFLISYALSGDELTLKTAAMGTTAGSSKMIGAGLIMFYVAFFISVIGLIYSFFHKATQ
jgi:hypothetical protein